LRAFGYGFASVLLGHVLAQAGLSPGKVGVVFTAMLAGMAIASLAAGRWADRFGRRRSYRFLLGLMGIAGALFAVTGSFPWLIVAALTGTLSTDANESGPITTLEQSMISHAPAQLRAHVFGRYNAV